MSATMLTVRELGLRYSRNLGGRTSLELVALRQAKDIKFGGCGQEPFCRCRFFPEFPD